MKDDTIISDELKEIHKNLLSLLTEFDELCENNNIKYSLTFGTLIGAIRHKGFIPWDDDVDIAIDRKNYNKLISAVNNSSVYEFRRRHWVRTFKRRNDPLSIDIFPYDNVPDNAFAVKLKVLTIKALQGMIDKKKDLSKYSSVYKIAVKMTSVLGKPFKLSTKQKWYDKVSVLGNKKKTKMICCYSSAFRSLDKHFKSDIFKSLKKVEFENKMYNSVKDHDTFLRGYYGDYMTPPPKCDCKPSHKRNCKK
ncbi:MAG: LicD family protein [Ruminococcus sp.]|nr:LicD family protein [Ruminococcus sp.]